MRPSKMYEKERIESEIKLCGQYGLKNKREIWRVQLVLTRLRKRARELLTLEEHDERRIFEGNALMRKMFKYCVEVDGWEVMRICGFIARDSIVRLSECRFRDGARWASVGKSMP